MTALTFRDYGFQYASGDSPALANVNLDLDAGLVTVVLAPQGAGKTTLLRAAAGMLGEVYDGEVAGSIVRAQSAEARGGAAVRRPAAFFDGYVQVTLAVETVREEIGLPLYAAGVVGAERDARVSAVARELGIGALLDRRVTELSGGEEKLVGIACAFVPDTTTYILDEPFEQLDVSHIASVIRAAKRRARSGRLVLVATGALDVAINVADVALLYADARWRLVPKPTYEDIARLSALGESPVMSFLTSHDTSMSGVRSFRDAVRRVS